MDIDNSLRFGELDNSGKITKDVKICAITGQPIEAGDAMVIVPGTGKFYRVKAPLTWPRNKDKYDEAHSSLAKIAKSLVTKSKTEVVEAAEFEPDVQPKKKG